MGHRDPASQSALLIQADNLLFHIQFKLGQKPGFPDLGPRGIAHQLLSNSSQNISPFKSPEASLEVEGRLYAVGPRLEGFSE